MKYAYPAVFSPEENGWYSVRFPDIPGCFTNGESLADSISMAEDALALILYEYEADGKPVPPVSKPETIQINPGEIVSFVCADTMEYRKRFNKKAVKKTLTIPEWLNEKAIQANVNFSQVLQDALIGLLKV